MSRRHHTQYTLCMTPRGQVRKFDAIDTEGRPCRRNVPGRTTLRRRAIAEQLGY